MEISAIYAQTNSMTKKNKKKKRKRKDWVVENTEKNKTFATSTLKRKIQRNEDLLLCIYSIFYFFYFYPLLSNINTKKMHSCSQDRTSYGAFISIVRFILYIWFFFFFLLVCCFASPTMWNRMATACDYTPFR